MAQEVNIMTRRHSICLSDIPSFSTPLSLGLPYDTYYEPNEEVTIFTVRRASSPVMLPTTTPATTPSPSNTTAATATATAAPIETNDQPEPPKAGKKKKNKKKNKSRKGKMAPVGVDNNANDNATTNRDDRSSSQNVSMPLIIDGAGWKHKEDKLPSETTTEDHAFHGNDKDGGRKDGLQRSIYSHRSPLYMNPRLSMQSSTDEFTPSVRTTEDTIRPSSVRSENSVQHQQSFTAAVCPEPGRVLCRFLQECCVHKLKSQYCSGMRSCCCMHHAGDCCYCFSSGAGMGAGNGTTQDNPFVDPTAHTHDIPRSKETQSSASRTPVASGSPESNSGQFSAHALSLLGNEEFCDCRIMLKSSKDNFYPISFRAHKALIARSPRIKSILKSPPYREGASNEIEAIAGETFCMVKAFETALQNLYGLPILNREQLRHAAVTALGYSDDDIQKIYPFPLKAALADFAVCYAASGAFFEDRDIVEAGMKSAADALDWDSVEIVLHFAICVSRFIIFSPNHTSSGPLTGDNESTNSDNSTVTHELRDTYAPRLAISALEYLVNHIPRPFTLHTSAQCRCMPDRIPEHLRSVPGSILSNPKLAEVKFGSFASLEEQKPGPEVATLSAILLCLPFRQLRDAFGIMGAGGVLSSTLAQAIVVEREARRLYALRVLANEEQEKGRGGRKGKGKGTRCLDVQELGYRECFTTRSLHSDATLQSSVTMQISLEREWVGLAVGENGAQHRGL